MIGFFFKDHNGKPIDFNSIWIPIPPVFRSSLTGELENVYFKPFEITTDDLFQPCLYFYAYNYVYLRYNLNF